MLLFTCLIWLHLHLQPTAEISFCYKFLSRRERHFSVSPGCSSGVTSVPQARGVIALPPAHRQWARVAPRSAGAAQELLKPLGQMWPHKSYAGVCAAPLHFKEFNLSFIYCHLLFSITVLVQSCVCS